MSKLALSVGRVNCEKSKKSLQGTFVKNGWKFVKSLNFKFLTVLINFI
jgi:hypothetical protein